MSAVLGLLACGARSDLAPLESDGSIPMGATSGATSSSGRSSSGTTSSSGMSGGGSGSSSNGSGSGSSSGSSGSSSSSSSSSGGAFSSSSSSSGSSSTSSSSSGSSSSSSSSSGGTSSCPGDAGIKTCGPGSSCCNGQCLDLDNDHQHCGDCTTVCGAGATCVFGVCQAPPCYFEMSAPPGEFCCAWENCSAGQICCEHRLCCSNHDGVSYDTCITPTASQPTCPQDLDCVCGYGMPCRFDSNCVSDACDSISLTCTSFHCMDHHLDRDETDVDCGGSCGGCPNGRTCGNDLDCTSGACDYQGFVCIANPCLDHHLDDTESDVDCGGVCPGCAPGQMCNSTSDCTVGHTCSASVPHVCQ
jgi:hypothetical protein